MLQKPKTSSAQTPLKYSRFLEIDGTHDFRESVPHGYVLYPVRELQKGEILYFNFKLAKEMGLLEQSHPEYLNKELETILLQIFCVQIVNEFDQQKGISKNWKVKPNKYMATRYLQIQHKSKSGKTSGDGRSIWLGQLKNNSDSWDISARGTGVTCLSPAYSQTSKPLQSGNTEFGYGCGTVDLDELLGTCIQSEIFYQQGINTERTLIIIKTGAKIGIGVRAGKNLFRPAHLFLNLRQKNIKRLRQSFGYFKERVLKNVKHVKETGSKNNRLFLWLITEMARFTAMLERNYIFLWMEWDGDNILIEPGVIDYGSIRQFGSYHNEYRYDDVTSWSTNLTEQKTKARHICSMYVQTKIALDTGKAPSLKKVNSHPLMQIFDKEFERHRLKIFYKNLGFEETHFDQLSGTKLRRLKKAFDFFHRLEKRKATTKFYDTGDGQNQQPLYDMRKFLSKFPHYLEGEVYFTNIDASLFFAAEGSRTLPKKDLSLWRNLIFELAQFKADMFSQFQLKESTWKATVINRNPLNRMTGNAVIMAVEQLIRIKDPAALSEVLNGIIKQQGSQSSIEPLKDAQASIRFDKINELIERYRTDI